MAESCPSNRFQWLKDAGLRRGSHHQGIWRTRRDAARIVRFASGASQGRFQCHPGPYAFTSPMWGGRTRFFRMRRGASSRFRRIAQGDIIGGAWTEVGEAKMARLLNPGGGAARRMDALRG